MPVARGTSRVEHVGQMQWYRLEVSAAENNVRIAS